MAQHRTKNNILFKCDIVHIVVYPTDEKVLDVVVGMQGEAAF